MVMAGNGSKFDYYRLLYAWDDWLWSTKEDQGELVWNFESFFYCLFFVILGELLFPILFLKFPFIYLFFAQKGHFFKDFFFFGKKEGKGEL